MLKVGDEVKIYHKWKANLIASFLPSPNVRHNMAVLNLLTHQSQVAFLAVIINSAIYVFFSWDIVSHKILIVWIASLYLLTLFRFLQQRRWSQRKQLLTADEIQSLFYQLAIGSTISGCLWGLLGFSIVMSDSVHLILTVFLLAGMTAGAIGAYSAHLPLAAFFLIFSLFPTIIRFFAEGEQPYYLMGFMLLIYFVLMLKLSVNLNLKINQSIDLSFENENLINKLNDASHEIKTPLTAIIGYADLLQRDPDFSEKSKNYVSALYRNADRLRKLIANILDVAKIKSGNVKIFTHPMSISSEITNSIGAIETELRRKNLRLDIDISSDIPDTIQYDPHVFQQIVVNLLSNAIKFTETGSILISATRKEQDKLYLRVTDTGIGIRPESVKCLFQQFYRENRPEVQNIEGSGLGLSLARNLARNLGGDLSVVETKPGIGSTFEFYLGPVMKCQDEIAAIGNSETTNMTSQRLKGLRILVVDDSVDLLNLIQAYLEEEGAVVEHGRSGVACVERITQQNNDLDIILMDVKMPIMDGYEATRLVRKLGFKKTIFAMSAHSIESIKQKCIEQGFDHVIKKPIDFDNLITMIQKYTSPSSGPEIAY